jgi:phosphoglycerate dehydrogenase-like enzyme
MVIIGTGEIGSRIARYTQGIGMRVIGVQRSTPTTEQPFEEVHHPSKLHELLPRAEWLVVACPLTDETRGMVDEHAFSLLPRGAHLINVARGAIVDELAMIEALSSGVLGGAYLDVTAQEPLPTESPLWAFPNVLVTPHNSSISASYADRSAEMFFANLVRWGRGEALQNFVG